jgi:lipoate-protein ligase B
LERSSSKLFIGPQQLGEFEVLDITDSPASRRVPLLDYSATGSPIPFETAWDWQKELLDNHVERISREIPASQFLDETTESDPTGLDTVIMLQHAPVYTLGTGSDEKFVLFGESDVPVVRMDRGGEV